MTQPVTLELAAKDVEGSNYMDSELRDPCAALIRAAQVVVEACRALVDDAARPERGRSLRVCAVHFEAGSEALAAFDKAGEKP